MADPNNDEAARALERLSTPQSGAPTPQPKPRAGAPGKPAPKPPARPPAPVPSTKPAKKRAPEDQDLLQAVAASSRSTTRTKPRAKPPSTGMAFRRTVIPILLTSGFIVVALATVHYVWQSDDNPVIELSTPIVLSMFAIGAVSWLLAAANMLAVRRAGNTAS